MTTSYHHLRPKGRTELLEWLNTFLDTNYQKVEDLKDGIAYTQLFDAIFQSKLPLHKIDINANTEDVYIKNLMFLEDIFAKRKISYHINVERIAKGKFPDNMEFLQWCYTYITRFYPTAQKQYNAKERRKEAWQKKQKSIKRARQSSARRRRQMEHRRSRQYKETGEKLIHAHLIERGKPKQPIDVDNQNVNRLLAEYPFEHESREKYLSDKHEQDPFDEHEQMVDFVLKRSRSNTRPLQNPNNQNPIHKSMQRNMQQRISYNSDHENKKHQTRQSKQPRDRKLIKKRDMRKTPPIDELLEEALLNPEEEREIKRTLLVEMGKHVNDIDLNDEIMSFDHSPDSKTSSQEEARTIKLEHERVPQVKDSKDPMFMALEDLMNALETQLCARMRSNRKKHSKLYKLSEDRNFYEEKLKKINEICQSYQNVSVLKPVKEIINYREPLVFHRPSGPY